MKIWQTFLFAVIAVVFAVFLIWPIYQVVKIGFFGIPVEGQSGSFTLGYIGAVFRDAELRSGLLNSAMIAICVTLLCTLISVPLAMLSVRLDFWGKSFLTGLLLVPLVLPPFVGAIGMRQIFGRFGALTAAVQDFGIIPVGQPVDWLGTARVFGIIVMEALSLYPILFLNVSAALANIDPALEQAAANLGADRKKIFWRVTFPLMRPGLFAGSTIVLIWSFTELGTPLMFDFYRVTPVQIYHQLAQVRGNPMPYALVIVMLISSSLLFIGGKLILGRRHEASVAKASLQSSAKKLNFVQSIPVMLPFLVISALALLPHAGVILMSVTKVGTWYQSVLPKVFTGEHFAHALTHELAVPSVANSVMLASASTVLDVVLGVAIAFVLVRTTIRGRAIIDALSMLPLAVPGIVLAFGYLSISLVLQAQIVEWEKAGWKLGNLKEWVNVQENPVVFLIIAYAMRRLPYVVRSATAGLEQTPRDLELASKNLGASGFTTLRRITIPLIAANLAAGAILAFAFAVLEVSDSLILAQKQAYWPITKAVYELYQRLGDGPYIASALGVWAMVLLTLAILSANSLLGKRMGAIFRV